MAWFELTFTLPRALLAEASELLFRLGSSGLQEDLLPQDVRPQRQVWEHRDDPEPECLLIRAWFSAPDREAIADELARLLPPGAEFAWQAAADVPWEEAWKEDHVPLKISDSLVVAPPWNAPAGALLIEPGQGFGTGQHPTTRLVLRSLEEFAPDCRSALDVGCGSGILALAAARLGLEVRGIDHDPLAVESARHNAELNQLPVVFSTTPLSELSLGADMVLANLHAEVLVEVAQQLRRLCQARLILSGILLEKEEQVRAAYSALELLTRQVDGRWLALTYRADHPSRTSS